MSADGKTMTVTTRGKDEAGRTLNTVAVYDRVDAKPPHLA